jgi:mRNA interferase HigB
VRIYSRSTLVAFWEAGHATAEGPLRAWFAIVEKATWNGPADIRKIFSTADFIGSDRVIFNVGGNNYRLIVRVAYNPYYAVNVCFIGTHAEYARVDAATVKQQ